MNTDKAKASLSVETVIPVMYQLLDTVEIQHRQIARLESDMQSAVRVIAELSVNMTKSVEIQQTLTDRLLALEAHNAGEGGVEGGGVGTMTLTQALRSLITVAAHALGYSLEVLGLLIAVLLLAYVAWLCLFAGMAILVAPLDMLYGKVKKRFTPCR